MSASTSGLAKDVYVSRGGSVIVNNKVGILPLYPVRYAYANFFEQSLSEPTEPPPLSTLLRAGSINKGNGYMVRLLRQGWIYIREEDDPANGYFHIFKYQQVERYGEIVEHFSKHLFKNRRNAQDGLVEDRSGRAGNRYPFVFVRRDVQDISIVYSEHKWSADVIDHMNASADTRAKSMQRVNLSAENDPHTLRATPENLSQLVEDYRDRQRRLLKLSHSPQDANADDISLDILTTQQSY